LVGKINSPKTTASSLKAFGKQALPSMIREIAQLVDKGVFKGVHAENFQEKPISALMFIKLLYDADGNVVGDKARLAARGDEEVRNKERLDKQNNILRSVVEVYENDLKNLAPTAQIASLFMTAAIAASNGPSVSGATESWNGTSWTSVNSMNTARKYLGGCGIQTAGLVFGGATPSITAATELWDGTNWSSAPPMTTARFTFTGSGTQAAGLQAGGQTPSFTNITEEFTGPQTTATASTLTTS
jgi:hypothetical protein